jgi:glyoxylase-like metal-dependent hydrolase (beta-lactamase superfamily II)
MKKVGTGIFMVGGYVNAYVVDGDQGVTLIDTGLPKRDGLITDALNVIGRRPADVMAIVLTHSHNDHTGGAALLKEATGATLIAPELETAVIEGRAQVPPPPMLAGPLSFLNRLTPRALPANVDVMVTEAAQEGCRLTSRSSTLRATPRATLHTCSTGVEVFSSSAMPQRPVAMGR